MSKYGRLIGVVLITLFMATCAFAADSSSSGSSGSSGMDNMANPQGDTMGGSSGSSAGMGSSGMSSGPVDINSASADQLKSLKGINDQLAQNIIDYRNSNGPFKSINELKNVKGMTNAKFNQIKSDVTVQSGGSSSMPESPSSPSESTSPSAPSSPGTKY